MNEKRRRIECIDFNILRFARCAALLMVFFAACSQEKSPESFAETFIESCTETIEKRQLRKLAGYISPEYHDQQDRKKQDILSFAAAYIYQNKSIHLFTRLQSARLENNQIAATILAAAAGRPIQDVSFLPALNADMYWVDLILSEEEGTWLLRSITWRQAMLDDFLSD